MTINNEPFHKGICRGVQLNPPFHFIDFATTQLASFPESPHVAFLTLVHLSQNEEEKKLQVLGLFSLKDQLQPVKMLSFLKQLVQIV